MVRVRANPVGRAACRRRAPATSGGGSTAAAVQWNAVVAPDGGAVTGYYVQRYSGGTPSPACASSPGTLLAGPSTSCSDVNVPDGTYTYTITAVFHGWTAVSAATGPVTVRALDHFVVSAPAGSAAGSAFSVAVTAKDAAAVTLTGYTGSVRFTSSDPGTPTLPADYTFVVGDGGTHTFAAGVTLTTAGSRTVTVADAIQGSKTGSANVTVTAATASRVAFSVQTGAGPGAWRGPPSRAWRSRTAGETPSAPARPR